MKYHEALLTPHKIEKGPDMLWMQNLRVLNEGAHLQGHYKVYRNEMRDRNEANHSMRESVDQRRGKLEGIIAQHK